MIIEALCLVVEFLLGAILNVLEVLPEFPAELVATINSYLSLVFDNVYLISFFVRLSTLKVVIPILILILNFERVYRFIMWILRKIPVVNIK